MPKLIPRTHNDYIYNSKIASAGDRRRRRPAYCSMCLPIAHNLPLACPGLQGYLLQGRARWCSRTRHARAKIVFRFDREASRYAYSVVPALLIRLLTDPLDRKIRSFVPASHSNGRTAPPARSAPTSQGANSKRLRSGEFRHGRRHVDVRALRRSAPMCAGNRRPTDCPDDEIKLLDDDDNEVAPGEVGEILLPRAVHAARLLTVRPSTMRERFQSRRFLSFRRSDASASVGKLHGRGAQEGSHQPRRREDQRRGN